MQELPKTDPAVGIDVGLKEFAVLTDGTVYNNPKYYRSLEKKLAGEQRILSRRREQAIKRKCKLTEAKIIRNNASKWHVYKRVSQIQEMITCIKSQPKSLKTTMSSE